MERRLLSAMSFTHKAIVNDIFLLGCLLCFLSFFYDYFSPSPFFFFEKEKQTTSKQHPAKMKLGFSGQKCEVCICRVPSAGSVVAEAPGSCGIAFF